MDPYGSASTKGTWGIDKNPSESFEKVMSRYMNNRLKVIGLQCRPMDMPHVKNIQPIHPAETPLPQRHLNAPPISTNYQPLHIQTTAPNPPPPVPANGIIWVNGHSRQNADHNNFPSAKSHATPISWSTPYKYPIGNRLGTSM